MKKILVALLCFGIGVGLVYGVNAYRYSKARRDFVTYIQPNLTPSQTLQYYWQSSAANQIEDVKLFATKTPPSYWIRCAGELPGSSSTREETQTYGKEFEELTELVAIYTGMLRASKPGLSRLKIEGERVHENEAVVDFIYEVTPGHQMKEQAYFFHDGAAWKLFSVNSREMDWMIVEEYARPREKCQPAPEFTGERIKVDPVTIPPRFHLIPESNAGNSDY